jgi:CheY-like chemotaxis protein
VESIVGKGTRITLCFPRATEEFISPELRAQENRDDPGTGTVLLVEDNPDVATATAVLLEQLGYTVRNASNADSVLQLLEETDNTIDVILSDIVMPGKVDGLELARAVRQMRPGLPVLLATGYSDAVQNVRAEFPILRKPYQIGELSRALAGLLAGRSKFTNLLPFTGKRVRPTETN